jgi:catechol 2,3-dioxygenase-like lactoylglutathione lyase family enzyme
MLRPTRILETVLYARQLDAMLLFYRDVLGLDPVRDWGEAGLVFRVNPQSVLLIFDPTRSIQPGRPIPSHGADGPGHLALEIREADRPRWLERLDEHGVRVEHEQQWRESEGWRTGSSIYIRDPAGNSVELITADIWPDKAQPRT